MILVQVVGLDSVIEVPAICLMLPFTADEMQGLLELLERNSSESLENERTEFKEYLRPDDAYNASGLADEVMALANWKGGIVVIGVRDSSKIVNGDWPAQLVGAPELDLVMLKERILGRLVPRIRLDLRRLEYKNKSFVAVLVPFGHDALVATTSGRYLVRDGRSSRPMNPGEITQRIRTQTSYDWSSEVVDVDVMSSLDSVALQAALHEFRRLRGLPHLDAQRFLETIEATKNGILTRGGLLFLGDDHAIDKELGDFEYRFTWRTGSGALKVNDSWRGCIWSSVVRASSHFQRFNQLYTFEYQGKKHTAYTVDPVAFHEAYVNALVHRDYASDGMVAVDFSGDLITITNPGAFYDGVTSANIYMRQRYRNKALARILLQHKMVDRAGEGVVRMTIKSLYYGRKRPVFIEVDESLKVTLEAQLVREPVFHLASTNEGYGIAELLILNSVCDQGFASVFDVLAELQRSASPPWPEFLKATRRLASHVQLCATADGVYVCPTKQRAEYFNVHQPLFASRTSDILLKTYLFLQEHGSAPTTNLATHLGFKQTSQVTRNLRDVNWLQRETTGRTTTWQLRNSES